jgi:DNA-binding LacI/PurR family transcriptional regulator
MTANLNQSIPRKYTGRAIVRDLETYIRVNGLAAGVRLPTGLELSRKYQVSLKTVERAMAVLVQRGLIGRIRGCGSYVKAAPQPAKKYRLALFYWGHTITEDFPELDYAAYDIQIQKLTASLGESSFNCEMIRENSYAKKDLHIFRMDLSQYDAIIAAAGFLDTAAELLSQLSVPVILINDDIVHPGPWHQVIYDYRPGFAAALRHFMAQGQQQFFLLGQHGNPVSERRFAAIRAEAELAGIPADHLIVQPGRSSVLSSKLLAGRDCAACYCQQELFSHAVISTSDYITYGFLSYMHERNFKAGQDFKLISYDNLEAKLQNPSLKLGISAITHPIDAAVQAVVDLAETVAGTAGQTPDYYKIYTVPATELVLRSSG